MVIDNSKHDIVAMLLRLKNADIFLNIFSLILILVRKIHYNNKSVK